MTVNEKINAMSVEEKADVFFEMLYGYRTLTIKDNLGGVKKNLINWLESEVEE